MDLTLFNSDSIVVGKYKIEKSGYSTIKHDLSNLHKNPLIRIQAEKTFVPSKWDESNSDDRELSVRVLSVRNNEIHST